MAKAVARSMVRAMLKIYFMGKFESHSIVKCVGSDAFTPTRRFTRQGRGTAKAMVLSVVLP